MVYLNSATRCGISPERKHIKCNVMQQFCYFFGCSCLKYQLTQHACTNEFQMCKSHKLYNNTLIPICAMHICHIDCACIKGMHNKSCTSIQLVSALKKINMLYKQCMARQIRWWGFYYVEDLNAGPCLMPIFIYLPIYTWGSVIESAL